MAWQENLFSNLLVVAVLGTLAGIIYVKITNKTIPDLIREIREAFSTTEE